MEHEPNPLSRRILPTYRVFVHADTALVHCLSCRLAGDPDELGHMPVTLLPNVLDLHSSGPAHRHLNLVDGAA